MMILQKGVTILEQEPIKDYISFARYFSAISIGIAIFALMIFCLKNTRTGSKYISFEDILNKALIFFYALGICLSIFAAMPFPWFYQETGRYEYKCVFEDNISANSISENFNIIGVEGKIWTIQDK